jgi:hypothetical protein
VTAGGEASGQLLVAELVEEDERCRDSSGESDANGGREKGDRSERSDGRAGRGFRSLGDGELLRLRPRRGRLGVFLVHLCFESVDAHRNLRHCCQPLGRRRSAAVGSWALASWQRNVVCEAIKELEQQCERLRFRPTAKAR